MSPLKVFYDPPSFIFYVSNFTFLAQKPKTGPLLHSTLYSIDLKASDRAKKAADCPTAAFNFTAYRLESRRLSHCCIQLYSIDLKAPQTGPLLHSTLIFCHKSHKPAHFCIQLYIFDKNEKGTPLFGSLWK